MELKKLKIYKIEGIFKSYDFIVAENMQEAIDKYVSYHSDEIGFDKNNIKSINICFEEEVLM
jgi:hypothetical protein